MLLPAAVNSSAEAMENDFSGDHKLLFKFKFQASFLFKSSDY